MWDDVPDWAAGTPSAPLPNPTTPPSQADAARSVSASDWFFRLGDTILSGVDRHYRTTDAVRLASTGRPVGVAADGSLFIQGQPGSRNQFGFGAPGAVSGRPVGATQPAASSPLLLIAAAGLVLFLVLRKCA
jgi:hypothetical protein